MEEIMGNWEHRSNGLKCATCMWFVYKKKADGTASSVGRCRKAPPVVMEGWPVVFNTDWCGTHKLDENLV